MTYLCEFGNLKQVASIDGDSHDFHVEIGPNQVNVPKPHTLNDLSFTEAYLYLLVLHVTENS